MFWGPVGTGKSFIAGCIANELLKQEVTVKETNFNTIIDEIFPLTDKTEYINALASYQLLIIDDLGVERNSEYALGIIFSVIDRRIPFRTTFDHHDQSSTERNKKPDHVR